MNCQIEQIWKPHILEVLRKEEELSILNNTLFKNEQITNIKEKFKIFRKKIFSIPNETFRYHNSLNLNTAVPVTPRLDIEIFPEEDTLNASKFFGYPNMSWWEEIISSNQMLTTINSLWPQCCHCHKPLQFLGQLNLSDWIRAIHLITYQNTTDDNWKKQDIPSAQFSIFGSGEQLNINYSCSDFWLYFFYCNCSAPITTPNAAIILRKKYKEVQDLYNKLLETPDISKIGINYENLKNSVSFLKEKTINTHYYKGILKEFMSKKEIPLRNPTQIVKNLELQFELDYSFNIPDNLNPPLNTTFILFGKNRKKNFQLLCPSNYNNKHYQVPIIYWYDQRHDTKYQIYGCFQCLHNGIIWARTNTIQEA